MSIVDDFENLIENRVRSLVVTPCLAKIIKVDGNLCDCEGIDIEDPESRAIYPLLEIPTLLGTKGGGIGGKPAIGSIVLLNFLNGDRNHPIISALIKGENSGNFTSLPKDKIKISSNGKDLGEILVKFCDMISQLQMTGSMGPSTMSPSQIFEWKLFVDKEIKGMFAVGLGSENDNDNGENEEQDSLSEATKQAYLDISFNDKELTELDTSGKYELQSYDLLAIEEDYLLFWTRLEKYLGKGSRSETVQELCIADEYFTKENKLPASIGVPFVYVLHEEVISSTKSKYHKEITILQKIAQGILGVEDVHLLVYNYTKHRVVYNEYQSSQKYSFKTLKTLLENAQKESMKTIDLSFIELGISLAELGAEALDFSDEAGLEFLFDNTNTNSTQILVDGMEENAIDNLFELTKNAFYELGTEFEPVQINSGFRSTYEQAGIMLKLSNLDAYGATKYFIEYLRLIEKGNEVEYTAYYEANKGEDRGDFSIRIGNKNEQLIIDVQTKDVQTVLGEYIRDEKYQPSKHPYGLAYDIQKSANIDTTKYIYDNHEGGKGGQYKGHYHISVS